MFIWTLGIRTASVTGHVLVSGQSKSVLFDIWIISLSRNPDSGYVPGYNCNLINALNNKFKELCTSEAIFLNQVFQVFNSIENR